MSSIVPVVLTQNVVVRQGNMEKALAINTDMTLMALSTLYRMFYSFVYDFYNGRTITQADLNKCYDVFISRFNEIVSYSEFSNLSISHPCTCDMYSSTLCDGCVRAQEDEEDFISLLTDLSLGMDVQPILYSLYCFSFINHNRLIIEVLSEDTILFYFDDSIRPKTLEISGMSMKPANMGNVFRRRMPGVGTQ